MKAKPLSEQLANGSFREVDTLLKEEPVPEPVWSKNADGGEQIYAAKLHAGCEPSRLLTGVVPRLLTRYQFCGAGLRTVISFLPDFEETFWHGEPVCFAAFGSTIHDGVGLARFPFVSLQKLQGGAVQREVGLVSAGKFLQHDGWLFPAVYRWCVTE